MVVAAISCVFNYFLGEELLFRGVLAWSLPSRYFRSNWFAIILHGLEGIPLLLGVFAVVSGLGG